MRNVRATKEYDVSVREYLTLGFAEVARRSCHHVGGPTYYMEHQADVEEDRDTTNLRIVLSVSSNTAENHSLHDALPPGPKLKAILMVRFLDVRT